jgi:hypothetical protein
MKLGDALKQKKKQKKKTDKAGKKIPLHENHEE